MTHKKVFHDNAMGYKIRCEKCGSQGCWWHTRQEAIDTWNTRPELDRLETLNAELVEALEYLDKDFQAWKPTTPYVNRLHDVVIKALAKANEKIGQRDTTYNWVAEL